ncbi:MAG: transcriptional repressor [Myxococcales bacterium]|nr:transcriptional repressor [Myxococcales bacterium]
MEGSEQLDRFRDFLNTQGLRFTKQRQAIAEVFFGTEGHLSLPELLDLARRRHSSVGYATVYRTMKILAESGLATEHKFAEGSVRYEPAFEGEHHDHLICVTCGRIVEYEDHEIERLQEELARKHGFRVVSHRHEIYAECMTPNCPELGRPQETDISGRDITGMPSTGS